MFLTHFNSFLVPQTTHVRSRRRAVLKFCTRGHLLPFWEVKNNRGFYIFQQGFCTSTFPRHRGAWVPGGLPGGFSGAGFLTVCHLVIQFAPLSNSLPPFLSRLSANLFNILLLFKHFAPSLDTPFPFADMSTPFWICCPLFECFAIFPGLHSVFLPK